MILSTDKIAILGRSGCGKSYLAKRIQSMWPRRIIIDSLNEYTEGDVVHTFDEFGEKLKILKNSNSKEFVLVFKFDPESHVNDMEFNEIMRCAYYFGNVQVVIEEVQLYSTTHSIPHWLKSSLLTGRHQNMSILVTSQRPGEVHKTIISQCSHVFCGTVHEGNDIRYLANFLNEDADRLASLPDRRFLYFSKNGISEISNEF